MVQTLNLVVLLSGSGRTLENFQQLINQGRLNARIAIVVSSKGDAYGLVRAQQHGIDAIAIPRKRYGSLQAFNDAINDVLARYDIDLVVLAGFLSLYRPAAHLVGRVMNIHPALLPAFGGKGMYGDRVHRAVIESGVKVSGCTVHFADEQYDQGPIILQKTVPVEDDDSVKTLAARVFAAECEIYPKAIQLYAENRLEIKNQRVSIRPSTPC